MNNYKHTIVTSCAIGLESLVSEEIISFGGAIVENGPGVVVWLGGLESGYRACLWSRYGSRVMLQFSSFLSENEDTLYEEVKKIPWQEHMDVNTTFAIDARLAKKANINHSKFAALRVKDAVVDYFRDMGDTRPSVKVVRPDIQLSLYVDDTNMGFLYLDLSGESLHRRGYREEGVLAPLKENLGAGIVGLTGWDKKKVPLLDPMCGSGTLLIEAAMMFGDSAPGLSRSYFGFLGWRKHDESLWSDLIDEAVNREEVGLEKSWPEIKGFDSDQQAVKAARRNVELAGLADKITIDKSELFFIPEKWSSEGFVICNPPYGERLEEKEQVAKLYRGMGHLLSERYQGWGVGVFISNGAFSDLFGIEWVDRIRMYNGSIPCRLLVGVSPPPKESWPLKICSDEINYEEGEDFANRLKKNAKSIMKWAAKEGVNCYRIYDRDLPDYNISVDIYDRWLLIQEYTPPKTIDAEVASKRFSLTLTIVRRLFNLRRDRVFIKRRVRQKGKKQYEKKGDVKKFYEVKEGGVRFLVNFTDYLDSGLFLDHRPTRIMLNKISENKRVLNLFGYTGTVSVHAAAGGAVSTTTVDLSQNYLDWARMNFSLNGLDKHKNKLVNADCMEWLDQNEEVFDIIFIDPPTFSNTKKKKRIFDVQKDHCDMINKAMKHLRPDGVLIFSCNFRSFNMDSGLGDTFKMDDVSQRSIPKDFARNTKIHQCWEIRHS